MVGVFLALLRTLWYRDVVHLEFLRVAKRPFGGFKNYLPLQRGPLPARGDRLRSVGGVLGLLARGHEGLSGNSKELTLAKTVRRGVF